MEYFLTEQQKLIKSIARRIAEERILPVRAELDEKEQFPWEIIKDIANADLFRIFIPEQYEGMGEGSFALCIAVEELSRACAGVALTYAADALGAFPILLYASEEQKQQYLPAIASGDRLTAFGLTESGAGSDAGSHQDNRQARRRWLCHSTAPSSSSPTAARPRYTPSSP